MGLCLFVPEEANREKLAAKTIHKELNEADEANLLEEAGDSSSSYYFLRLLLCFFFSLVNGGQNSFS